MSNNRSSIFLPVLAGDTSYATKSMKLISKLISLLAIAPSLAFGSLLSENFVSLSQVNAQQLVRQPQVNSENNADKFTLPRIPSQFLAKPTSPLTVLFQPRPNRNSKNGSRPLEGVGAGTRGNGKCIADRQASTPDLTLIVPTSSSNVTAAERPTFWFYVPQTAAQQLEFSLFETTPNVIGEYKTGIYQVTMSIARKAVVTGYALPVDAPALVPGKSYEWAIALVCEPGNRQRDVNASGIIERVALSAPEFQALQQASAQQKPTLYGNLGLWSDTLTTLVGLRQSLPQLAPQIETNWKNLLQLELTGEIASQPLAQ